VLVVGSGKGAVMIFACAFNGFIASSVSVTTVAVSDVLHD